MLSRTTQNFTCGVIRSFYWLFFMLRTRKVRCQISASFLCDSISVKQKLFEDSSDWCPTQRAIVSSDRFNGTQINLDTVCSVYKTWSGMLLAKLRQLLDKQAGDSKQREVPPCSAEITFVFCLFLFGCGTQKIIAFRWTRGLWMEPWG